MKRLYFTLALAVLVVCGASAARTVKMKELSTVEKTEFAVKEVVKSEVAKDLLRSTSVKKASAKKAPALSELDEEYYWDCMSALPDSQGDLAYPEENVFFWNDSEGNPYIVLDNMWAVPVEYDATAGTLTLKNQYLMHFVYDYEDDNGEKGRYDWDVYFQTYAMELDEETNMFVLPEEQSEATVGVYDAESNCFVFPDNDLWQVRIFDHETEQNLGLWFRTYYNAFIEVYVPVDPYTWEPFGTAIFEDGWVTPSFGLSASEYPIDVTVEKATNAAGVFRLKDPFVNSILMGAAAQEGAIVLDLSDPDCVLALPHYFAGLQRSGYDMYLFNGEGLLAELNDATKEQLKTLYEKELLLPSTLEGKIATISNCYWWDNPRCDDGAGWNGVPYSEMVSKITFDKEVAEGAGVSNITVSDNEGAVRYFNLQGVEIARPESGIAVRVQGGKATKVLVR